MIAQRSGKPDLRHDTTEQEAVATGSFSICHLSFSFVIRSHVVSVRVIFVDRFFICQPTSDPRINTNHHENKIRENDQWKIDQMYRSYRCRLTGGGCLLRFPTQHWLARRGSLIESSDSGRMWCIQDEVRILNRFTRDCPHRRDKLIQLLMSY